jgi:hypothetical protein
MASRVTGAAARTRAVREGRETSPLVRAQAAKTLLAIDRRLGRASDPQVVELAKGAPL